MRKLYSVIFSLLFFSAAAFAIVVPQIQVQSPSNGMTIPQGASMTVSLTTNYDIESVYVDGFANGQFVTLHSETIPVEAIREYSASVDTQALPVGPVTISIGAHPYSPDFGTQGVSIPVMITAPADVPIPQEETPQEEQPQEGGVPEEGLVLAATVFRSVPADVLAGGIVPVNLTILPTNPFPGIILRENIPTELRFDGMFGSNNLATFDHDLVTGGATNTLKIVGRKSDGIGVENLGYLVQIPGNAQAGDTFRIDGNWSTETSNGPIFGTDLMRVMDGFRMPTCPLSDEQLLTFITQWSREEITNNLLLQVIQIWMSCNNPEPT